MSSGVGSSSSNGGRGKGNNNGVPSIPATSRKIVQSLKEIVNCPEHEIYAMLKECNMDPNDAVQRLLSQDTFHEVKSRKEKKKELKETSESRPRGVNNTTNRGGWGGTDRYVGRNGSTQFSSTESGVARGKPAYKKESGANAFPSSSTSAPGMPGNNINQWPTPLSDSGTSEHKTLGTGSGDFVSSSSQPSPRFQNAWLGGPGQVSMADIVKMGRPHGKASNTSIMSTETTYSTHAVAPNTSHPSVKYTHISEPISSESHHDPSQDPASKVSETTHGSGIAAGQHVSHDEWPLAEQSSASGSSVLESSASPKAYGDRANLHLNSWSDEVQGAEGNITVENLNTDSIEYASASSKQIQEESSGGVLHFNNDSFNDMNPYQSHRHAFEYQEGIGGSSQLSIPNYSLSSVEDVNIAVSSAAANLQQLSLQKEELGVPHAQDNPAVIIPNHLQVPTADCSHLSFGSFGSAIGTTFPGSFASKSLKHNLEEASSTADGSSVGHSDTRNPEYFGDAQLQSTLDGNIAPRSGAGAGSYESPSSQPEAMKHDTAEATHENQYTFPTSVPGGYTLESNAQPNAAFSYAQTNSQMQNLAPFSSVMQAYTNSLQGNLFASTVQPPRESDNPYSPFLATQSMPTKYSAGVSSISGPTISMQETVKPGIFSTPHLAPQTLPGTSITSGPTLPQHLAVHPYSQPTLPLGHFANMISYPFLPQSYTYMPSAFQQAYAGNSTYHQSPAAVQSAGIKYTLPQYKNTVPVSSLPQSAIPSGYGSFGSSANIPGGFPLNPSSAPASTTISYDDVISSQYKDNNHFVPLQQNESSPVWVHGPGGSRTVSALPGNTYYSFQGQNQQHSGYRQGQQPSQHYGSLGYPNFYHSQAGVSQEHHQQTSNDGALNGSQGQPTKQSHQIWQHSY